MDNLTHTRIAIGVEYAGTEFSGSQLQVGARTVQQELEAALNVFFRTGESRAIKVHFSGRTDSGVHAQGQVAHFDLSDDFLKRCSHSGNAGISLGVPWPGAAIGEPPSGTIQAASLTSALSSSALQSMCWALNGILPKDVSIVQAQIVQHDFHARYSARRRTYVYRILNRPQRSALRQATHHFLNSPLQLESMKAAAKLILGRHDFSSFKSSNRQKINPVCLVDRSEILNKGEGELEFWISADHFVYNMVRIIVGTLIEVGLNKRAPSALSEALAGKDRHLAGPTAPPWGLCLYSVDYPAEFNLFLKDSQVGSCE